MMELNLPNKIRLSNYSRSVTQAFDDLRPTHIVYHELTGDTLKISSGTEQFLKSLQNRIIFRSEILELIDSESIPVLNLLAEKRILVPATKNEYDSFLSFYPIVRGCISYVNPKGVRTFLFYVWNNEKKIHEVKEYAPNREVSAFLQACDGEKKLKDIEVALQKKWKLKKSDAADKIKNIISTLAAPDLQLLKFSARPYSELVEKNEHFAYFHHSLEEFSHSDTVLNSKKSAFSRSVIDLKKFHQTEIKDAFHEFESVEVTVSHAFRFPSSALSGRSYAGAFFDESQRLGFIKKEYSILEVGGGTGSFARALLARAHEKTNWANSLKYKIADLAPELQRSQKEITKTYSKQMDFVLCNAEALKIPSKSVDFLVSNEVVADLRTVLIKKSDLKKSLRGTNNKPLDLAKSLIKNYELPVEDAEDEFFFNLGTAKFIEEIYRVLKPGSFAFLSEFGGITDYPKPTTHLNHDEYSIHWGHMAFLAKRLGFKKAELIDLPSFIHFDPNHPMYVGDVHEIRHIFNKFAQELPPCMAYSKSEIEKISNSLPQAKIKGLEFAPLFRGMHWGPSPYEFKVLLLEK